MALYLPKPHGTIARILKWQKLDVANGMKSRLTSVAGRWWCWSCVGGVVDVGRMSVVDVGRMSVVDIFRPHGQGHKRRAARLLLGHHHQGSVTPCQVTARHGTAFATCNSTVWGCVRWHVLVLW
jgi:hypothetical protein